MEDSGSESGEFPLRTFGHDSDAEGRLRAEQQVGKYEEELQLLSQENATLRVQVDDVVKITEQLEAVHQKNKRLSSTVRQANADNDGLKQRLEIALRANSELSQ
jgi:Tfp pilus assembly protein PilN